MPVLEGRKGNFQINDIDLFIPPTNISVRKEDLVWEWKTLRTRVSTKVPSGHGMIQVSVTIPFTSDTLLDLHRLIVEFKHSPFCWVENQYLRESIVPEWPIWQYMAFTMTSLNVMPMIGNPGTFLLELDLRWFNYFPYAVNYLFRDDWLTLPIADVNDAETDIKETRIYSIPTLAAKAEVGTPLVKTLTTSRVFRSWSVTADQLQSTAPNSIHDLEALHSGIVFDGLPLPYKMQPSRFVPNPQFSNIYVRYINTLQQKALWNNFNIDVYEDISASGPGTVDTVGSDISISEDIYDNINLTSDPGVAVNPWDAFSSGISVSEVEAGSIHRVYGLHSEKVPARLRSKWIQQMLESTYHSDFYWQNYKAMDYPVKVYENIAETMKKMVELNNSSPQESGSGPVRPGDIKLPDSDDGFKWHPPIPGYTINNTTRPFSLNPIRNPVTHDFRSHLGSDIGANDGTEIHAIESGYVVAVESSLPNETSESNSKGNYITIRHDGDADGWESTYMHMSYVDSKCWIEGATKIKRGEVIGKVGHSGRATGAHLHITLTPPGSKTPVDPGVELMLPKTSHKDVTATEPKTTSESDTKLNLDGNGILGLTDDEKQDLYNTLLTLAEEGYYYYEEDPSVTNVFYRTNFLRISPSNSDLNHIGAAGEDTKEFLFNEGIVLTNVAGGLRNIVASIPILGHEYPTHQFLGSIEPVYQFEFSVLAQDDFVAGLSPHAQILEGMRAQLQRNARSFRVIPDCWTLSVDHFITRLLGSFREDDLQEDTSNGFLKLRKRASVVRSEIQTVEGSPGLSILSMQISETNPYDTEIIVATESKSTDIYERRKKVLAALDKLSLTDEAKNALLIQLGSKLNPANNWTLGEAWKATEATLKANTEFLSGIELNTMYGEPGQVYIPDTLLYRDYFSALGIESKELPSGILSSPGFLTDFNSLTENITDPDIIRIPTDTGTTSAPDGSVVYDTSVFTKHNPELSEYVLTRLQNLYSTLKESEQLANFMLADSALGGDALTENKVSTDLYNLPVQAHMWTNFLHAMKYFLNNGVRSTEHLIPGLEKEFIELSGPTTTDRTYIEQEVGSLSSVGSFASFIGSTSANTVWNLAIQVPFSIIQAPFRLVPGGVTPGEDTLEAIDDFALWQLEHTINNYLSIFPFDATFAETILGMLPEVKNAFLDQDKLQSAFGIRDRFFAFLEVLTKDPILTFQLRSAANPDAAEEKSKLEYIQKLIEAIADEILNDSDLLAVFGLGELADFDIGVNQYKGSECYPDLDLPDHPYYPEKFFATNPDFYMWNLYEDATGGIGGLSSDVLKEVDTQVEAALFGKNGPYQLLKSMQGQGINLNDKIGSKLRVNSNNQELSPRVASLVQNSSPQRLVHHPEGSDSVDFLVDEKNYANTGEMTQAFYPFDENEKYLSQGAAGIKELKKRVETAKSSGDKYLTKSLEAQLQLITQLQQDTKPLLPLLSLTDGNPQYASNPRAELQDYEQLASKIRNIEVMFGSRAGYLGQTITKATAGDIADSLQDTRLAALDSYTHTFTPEHLKRLAADSSSDILSQKLTLRRAYPTFKLFFIEEDESESRFLNFDDFYSYNAVKEFTVVQSRKSATDTAVIVLQNISGTLDGTKRNVTIDLDYFSRKKAEAIEKTDSTIDTTSDSLVETVSSKDQPFGAVVLREGMNIQLRAGYSNDPSMLEVLISGRVTDVAWNVPGDLVEITVQSFGTELVQLIKGNSEFGESERSNRTFKTTHQLLGSMMLSSELEHFGRWEIGQHFQIGEAKDSRLDFVDYSDHSFLGRFGLTTKLTRWMLNHPGYTFLAAAGVSIAAAFAARGGGIGNAVFGRTLKFLSPKAFGAGDTLASGAKISEQLAKDLAIVSNEAAKRTVISSTLRKSGLLNKAGELGLFRGKGGVSAALLTEYRVAVTALARASVGFRNEAAIRALPEFIKLTSVTNKISRGVAIRTITGYRGIPAPVGAGFWGGKIKPIGGVILGAPLTAFGRTASLAGRVALGAIVIDLANDFLFKPLYDKTIGDMQRMFARRKVSMMLSPQDDNLYPPSPKDYMRLDDGNISIEDIKKATFKVASSFLLADLEQWWGAWTRPGKYLMDKRVDPEQCEYIPQNVTIWDIFAEMSLRHPGWVHAVRPYGTQFRYTMFFGIPSQRYWAKPANNNFIARMIQLRRYLEKGNIDETIYTKLYGVNALDQLKTEVFGVGFINPKDPSQETTLTFRMTNSAMAEYLRGLELRFVPFRRYHLITSEYDLVHNGIISSEQNVANAISVTYFDLNDSQQDIPTRSISVKAHSQIPEYMLRMASVSYPNCRGYSMALRYGIGTLLTTMREMYRGEILILGNARIRPVDVCILLDSYNNMAGPIEVEQVVHTFSHETGFLTEIKPNALVFSNEISTWPMIEAMKLYIMAIKDNESGKFSVDASKLADETDWAEMASPEFRTHLAARYNEIFPRGFNINNIISQQDQDLIDNSLIGDTQSAIGTGIGIGAGLLTFGALMLLGKGAQAGALAYAGRKGLGAGEMAAFHSSRLVKGLNAFMAIDAAAAGGIIGVNVADFVNSPTAAWLVAGPILMLKCLEEETIVVIPLVKDNQPIVSGMSLKDPGMMWKNIKGNVTNIVDDTLDGTRDILQEWKTYGFAMWRRFKNPDLRMTQ